MLWIIMTVSVKQVLLRTARYGACVMEKLPNEVIFHVQVAMATRICVLFQETDVHSFPNTMSQERHQ